MLLDVLSRESNLPVRQIAVFAVIAGLSDALVVVVINRAAEAASRGKPNIHFLFAFVAVLGVYVFTQRYILRLTTLEIENTIKRIRVRLAEKIRNADLLPLERLGRSQIYAGINRDTLAISQAAAPIIIACQSALMVFFTIAYIGFLSPMALLLTLGVIVVGVLVHFSRLKRIMAQLHTASARENDFFEALTHLLDGFKEVKLSRARATDLIHHLREIASSAAELKKTASVGFADQYLFSQVSLNLLVAIVVFGLPIISSNDAIRIAAITAAVQFISGPLNSLVGAIPVFSNANVAVENIARLEKSLEQLKAAEEMDEAAAVQRRRRVRFGEIAINDAEMRYMDAQGEPLFTVGPLNLTITRGELIFLIGGNGSGKTTFLKLLTGLYYPDAGEITIDGVPAEKYGYSRYRELFSAIFTDYHLFDRLYGLGPIDDSRVNALVKSMQLEEKTRFVNGRFENQDLSSGQKKRLALIVSILEQKPICVFDEWAADQDPTFRQHFYEEFLMDLKSRGVTVIAATHDDRYFHLADRVLKMELGQLIADDMAVVQRRTRRKGA